MMITEHIRGKNIEEKREVVIVRVVFWLDNQSNCFFAFANTFASNSKSTWRAVGVTLCPYAGIGGGWNIAC
jgi:hypothetical protein